MSAVAHKETTGMIRRYGVTDVTVLELFQGRPGEPRLVKDLPAQVKREAVNAVGSKELAAQIRLVKDNGAIYAPLTPSFESCRNAQKISRLHEQGYQLNEIHREATKDKFGKDDYDR
jgi:hypothetical protein